MNQLLILIGKPLLFLPLSQTIVLEFVVIISRQLIEPLILISIPFQWTEDLYALLGGVEKFTKLDLSHAYQQLVLSPESCSLLAINTYQGLFHSTRLQFGVYSASGIFQSEIENLLKSVPFVKT